MKSGHSVQQAIQMAGQENSDGDPTGALSDTECLSDTQPGYTDGPNNTYYFKNGNTLTNQPPPQGILGLLDPPLCGNAASATPYGQGKPGTFGVPVLQSNNPPVLGQVADLTLTNALPGASSLWFVGLVQTQIPFDGGFLYTNPILTLTLPVPPNGSLSLPVPLPADPTLCGFPAYFQVMFVDPGASGFNHTAQTNGLAWVLGSWPHACAPGPGLRSSGPPGRAARRVRSRPFVRPGAIRRRGTAGRLRLPCPDPDCARSPTP